MKVIFVTAIFLLTTFTRPVLSATLNDPGNLLNSHRKADIIELAESVEDLSGSDLVINIMDKPPGSEKLGAYTVRLAEAFDNTKIINMATDVNQLGYGTKGAMSYGESANNSVNLSSEYQMEIIKNYQEVKGEGVYLSLKSTLNLTNELVQKQKEDDIRSLIIWGIVFFIVFVLLGLSGGSTGVYVPIGGSSYSSGGKSGISVMGDSE